MTFSETLVHFDFQAKKRSDTNTNGKNIILQVENQKKIHALTSNRIRAYGLNDEPIRCEFLFNYYSLLRIAI